MNLKKLTEENCLQIINKINWIKNYTFINFKYIKDKEISVIQAKPPVGSISNYMVDYIDIIINKKVDKRLIKANSIIEINMKIHTAEGFHKDSKTRKFEKISKENISDILDYLK